MTETSVERLLAHVKRIFCERCGRSRDPGNFPDPERLLTCGNCIRKERQAEARAAGEVTFDPGMSCRHGHEPLRWTNTGGCVICDRLSVERHKEKHPDYQKLWYERNRERAIATVKAYQAANREHLRDRQKLYKLSNAEQTRLFGKANDARRRSAEGKFTKDDIQALLLLQKGRCAGCRCDVTKKFHVDHIVALAKGGSNWPSNLQILCESCNTSKWMLDAEDWNREKFGRLL